MKLFRRLTASITAGVAAVLAKVTSVASMFNQNITAPHLTTGPASLVKPPKGRKPAYRTGIKGIKGTNHSQYGHDLVQRIAEARRLKAYRKMAGAA